LDGRSPAGIFASSLFAILFASIPFFLPPIRSIDHTTPVTFFSQNAGRHEFLHHFNRHFSNHSRSNSSVSSSFLDQLINVLFPKVRNVLEKRHHHQMPAKRRMGMANNRRELGRQTNSSKQLLCIATLMVLFWKIISRIV
jgi:hypothetical protein